MNFLLVALAAGTLTPDLQRELVVELLSGDTTILHPPPPKPPVSLAAARILASAPAPLTPLGEEEASAAPAATPPAVRSMTAQQRRAVCELGTDARCASVAEAMEISQPAAVCEFFSHMAEPAGEPRAAFCHGLADALVSKPKPAAAPAAPAVAEKAAPVVVAAKVEPKPEVPAKAEAATGDSPPVDAAALCADTVARVLPTARSLAAARSWSGRISSECEDAAAKREGRTMQDPAVAKVCWDLDGRLAMALEQGFIAKETGAPDPYADEKPSSFCARFAEGARRLEKEKPLLATKGPEGPEAKEAAAPVDTKTTVTVKTVSTKAVLEEPVAEKAVPEAAASAAKATGEPKPEVVAKAEAPVQAEPKAEVATKVEPKPEVATKVEPKPEVAAKAEPKTEVDVKVESKVVATKVAPQAPLVAAKVASKPAEPADGLVALLRTLADEHALLDQCVALSQGLSAQAADSEDLDPSAALETALPFNQHDQRLLDECGKALQQRGAKVLAGLAQPGALLATRSTTTDLVLDTALDSPWSAEVCSDMATSYLRMGRHDARRADFCRTYQAQFTHDDVAQLRRKPLRAAPPLTAKDAEAASEKAGSRFLEDAARAMAASPGNAAAVMWELQAPLPASLLETQGQTESRANSRGAALWRRR